MLEIKIRSSCQKIRLQIFVITVVICSGTIIHEIMSGSEVHAQRLTQESKSSSTSCINGQLCRTMICHDSQPCQVIQTPSSGLYSDKSSVHMPQEDPTLMSPNPYVGQPSID
jgi:hypothetical protein